MNRAGWQATAEERLDDAKALLEKHRWSCAYYIAGYAVECALKSCVLAYVEQSGIIFDNPKFLEGCRTHDLTKLVNLANLDAAFGAARGANPVLGAFWDVVAAWNEESRYAGRTHAEAEELQEAINNDPDGVIRWLRTRW